jgi:hypothetical protein
MARADEPTGYPEGMGWIVLLVAVATAFGLALAAYGRFRRTTAGITEHPPLRPDHPEENSPQSAFEQVLDDRGTR